jgi:hypothetical protein
VLNMDGTRFASSLMLAGRKAEQQGRRVKPPNGVTWARLAGLSPAEIKRKDLFPLGFWPLPHVDRDVGGRLFPKHHIDAICLAAGRDLRAMFVLPHEPHNHLQLSERHRRRALS